MVCTVCSCVVIVIVVNSQSIISVVRVQIILGVVV